MNKIQNLKKVPIDFLFIFGFDFTNSPVLISKKDHPFEKDLYFLKKENVYQF